MAFIPLRAGQSSTPPLSLDEAMGRVEERLALLDRLSQRVARFTLLLLFAASIAMAAFGVGSSLDRPFPGTGIVLILLTATPALLQLFDWLWPGVGVGQYRLAFTKIHNRMASELRRRWLRRLFEAYGCEETSSRVLPPEDAEMYSVERRLVRRRQLRNRLTVTALIGVLVIGAAVAWERRDIRSHEIGDVFALDETWKVAVIEPPVCKAMPPPIGQEACSIRVRLTNKGNFSDGIYGGNFTAFDHDGSWRYIDRYATSMLAGSYYYDYLPTDFGTEVQPGDSLNAELFYDVPTGVRVDEIRFSDPRAGKIDVVHL